MTGHSWTHMTLSEIFADPLDPGRSLQLNNKYWPGEKFGLLGVIADAEAILEEGKPGATARHLQHLRRFFPGDRFFAKFLGRLHRLSLFRSQFGCVSGHLDLSQQTIEANLYRGPETRASYPLRRANADDLGSLIKDTVATYKAQYGRDIVRTHCTVRFAKPDERQLDVTGHGVLSDYHNDEYKGISTIVYLCDVKDENGAFSFIRGSHLVPRSLILSAIHQCVAFDMALTTPHELTSVPLEFRGSPGIGNFIENDKADIAYRFLEIVEGRAGTFATFNGQYLLHRGGKPLSGSRTAVFFQPEGLLRHKVASVRSRLYELANR